MFFTQTRIGYKGIPFVIYKFRTYTIDGSKPTKMGTFLRKTKLDELPQIINLIKGEMVLVGPRPDIPGYADKLKGDDSIILHVKPGITGLASLKYRNEEEILANELNPLNYNDKVIWPDKVRINKWYVRNRSFFMDCKILFYTIFPLKFDVDKYMRNYTK